MVLSFPFVVSENSIAFCLTPVNGVFYFFFIFVPRRTLERETGARQHTTDPLTFETADLVCCSACHTSGPFLTCGRRGFDALPVAKTRVQGARYSTPYPAKQKGGASSFETTDPFQ